MINDAESIISKMTRVEGIKFPVARVQRGRDYAGLAIFDKPHNLKPLMQELVKDLSRGEKQYPPLERRYSKKYSMVDFLDAMEILTIAGIIQVESKNVQPKTQLKWKIRKLALDPRAEDELEESEPSKETEPFNIGAEAETILGPLSGILADLVRKAVFEEQILDEFGNVLATPKAMVKYRSVILALAWAAKLMAEKRREPLRVVSQRVWGDSKRLDAYKAEIVAAGRDTLDNLHLTATFETTLVHGNVSFKVNGIFGTMHAGIPACLTDATIDKLTITSAPIDGIFIIENIAVFREVLYRRYLTRPNIFVMFGEGFLSSSKRTLLRKLMEATRAIVVYVWGDIDASGLQIVEDIHNVCVECGSHVAPVLMSEDELELTCGKFIGSAHTALDSPVLCRIFPDVVEKVREGATMEQEELLIHWDKIESKLP
ncbi:Wadjet anti-phage system protein JetD domain-containing protein [Propionispora hippei]|uniref:Wadjet protein JetD C-terminal domain-containing protein n=1 Tax=Propionispora hippei DSM 15287 TaxID=1123003 RepID=A0A1M6GTK6_9FIRM|nr:Wadjet anti-phage system protein JetD domain-containing protein [Propionispora hippei]SHJ13285.1 hypothetical protein SAMN02745170_01823 [Propionispora hippei DSM 15287]